MTLSDLLSAHWTWSAVVRELLPIVVGCGGAFLAGYEYGWNRGFRRGARFDKAIHADMSVFSSGQAVDASDQPSPR